MPDGTRKDLPEPETLGGGELGSKLLELTWNEPEAAESAWEERIAALQSLTAMGSTLDFASRPGPAAAENRIEELSHPPGSPSATAPTEESTEWPELTEEPEGLFDPVEEETYLDTAEQMEWGELGTLAAGLDSGLRQDAQSHLDLPPLIPPEAALTLKPEDLEESGREEEMASEYAPPEEATLLSPASPGLLRQRIVAGARQEWERWGRGSKKETEPGMYAVLQSYWRSAVGSAAADEAIRERKPWSAVFVSWVMKSAGAGSAFRYSTAHRTYIAAAKRNRLSKNEASPFWAFDIGEVSPAPGDLVCRDRAPKSGSPCSGATYQNVDNGQSWPTHSDIVTEVRPGSIVMIGGNVGDSVTARTLRTDIRGRVIPDQATCRHFAIIQVREPGAAPPTVGDDWAKAVRLNRHYGERLGWRDRFDEIVMALGFTARSPGEVEFAQAVANWQKKSGIEVDGIIGPITWKKLLPVLDTGIRRPQLQPRAGGRVSSPVVNRIERYGTLIDRIAHREGVDPNIIRGIIAAESAGDPFKEAPSGYKGLMQADTSKDQFQPEMSIQTGTRKFKRFRDEWLGPRLRPLGIDLSAVDTETMVRWVVTAYNAGHVTVIKAVQYATVAGDRNKWMDPEHYRRALLFSGAFSISTAAGECLRELSADQMVRDLIQATGRSIEDIHGAFRVGDSWNIPALKKALVQSARAEQAKWAFKGKRCHWSKCPDPPPWVEVERSLPRLLLCSIAFKHRNAPGYVNRVVAYMNHFQGRT